MNLQQLQDYFVRIAPESIFGFMLNMFLAVALSYILSRLYIRYGKAFSDRDILARNFILITMTTMLVITVVKASLALSLGLVGALTIVRFRAAIKEPEELAYLFLSISIGLGLGAAARRTTIMACAVIFSLIWLRGQWEWYRTYPNLSLVLSKDLSTGKNVALQDLIDISKKYCQRLDMVRFEESDGHIETSFHIECKSFEQIQEMRNALKELDKSIYITFIDNTAGKIL